MFPTPFPRPKNTVWLRLFKPEKAETFVYKQKAVTGESRETHVVERKMLSLKYLGRQKQEYQCDSKSEHRSCFTVSLGNEHSTHLWEKVKQHL